MTDMPQEYVALIERYGYFATFVGTLLEGETLLILSGLSAHRGYLALPLVVIVGAAGGALGDLGFFLLGRHCGSELLTRFPRFAPQADRVQRLIERYPDFAILGVRFMYGLRTAGPAIIGSTRIPLARFVLLNVLGAAVWSACWTGAGYVLGQTAELLLGRVAHVERALLGVVVVLGIVAALALQVRRARARRRRV